MTNRYAVRRWLVIGCLVLPGMAVALTIRNSKHDLSVSSTTTGPKATVESQMCVFCHTPHMPNPTVPLWNHTPTAQTFTFYASNYTNVTLGIPVPAQALLTGSRTKLCLSCHDGVTALGGVYNLNAGPATIAMTAALGAAANLGIDLRNDHPVMYPVNAAQTDGAMKLPPGGDPVKVYGAQNLVECTSCHNAHDNAANGNTQGKFLVKANTNAAICTTCHVKAGFATSVHATSGISYTPPGFAATTVGEWSCRNCHRMHGASATQAYVLTGAEENTCFGCHSNPPVTGVKNIQKPFTYAGPTASRHPTLATSGVHIDPETDASNYTATPNKRHAECQDCHNPHQVLQNAGAKPAPNNLITNALLGQWGVEPTYTGGAGTAPTSFTKVTFTDTTNYKQYQLCFKCHSNYAYGATPPVGYTNQAIEFNTLNISRHPVLSAINNPFCTPATMVAPWNAGGTHSTMMCTDCHGSDTAGDPEGPHGSQSARILKASLIATQANVPGNWATPLCIRCHKDTVYAGGNGKALGSNYNHQDNNGMYRSPGSAGSPTYGGCLACHGNLDGAGVRGTFHGENDAPWASAPKKHFLSNTTNWTNWDEAGRRCYSKATGGGCHLHNPSNAY